MPKVTAEQIIDIAESMIRSNGYHSFSFREIASQVGIKSSSVHYHFPTKADLAVAVAKRYSDSFFARLDELSAQFEEPEVLINEYVNMFRAALTIDRKLCLCGMLGAEKAVLPPSVLPEVKGFFIRNLVWLSHVAVTHGSNLSEDDIHQRASCLLASLEGALIIAQTLEDDESFENIASLSQQDFMTVF
ncbi:TetR/AcrR family transcriptional regulator [Aliiglaciecola sp.]|nr:TetR/AcrR family transcriptional regulator [Aliiglaciecola sp.]